MIKFVLLSHARSGSTLLTLCLRSHPTIRMYGELFNDEETERLRAFEAGIRSRPSDYAYPKAINSFAYSSNKNAATFLQKIIYFDPSINHPGAVGFKLFYNQARSTQDMTTIWEYLNQNKEVRIIHLIRANLLESFLSLKTAMLTNEWALHVNDLNSSKQIKLELNPESVEEYFNDILKQRSEVLSELSSPERRILNLEYERDILADFDGTMKRIQNFLEIPYSYLSQPLLKQRKGNVADHILNYDILSEYFIKTQFKNFFQ